MHNFYMEIRQINIKEDNPPTDVAIYEMCNAIDLCVLENIKILKVIHGYGSHGKGGDIKKECIHTLKHLVRANKIYDYIPGEKFSPLNKYYKQIVEQYPPFLLDGEVSNNFGVTIVIITRL